MPDDPKEDHSTQNHRSPDPRRCSPYLSRYTHRVAFDQTGVTFHYKDYRRGAANRQQPMTLTADEFIRRFLLHVLPKGFHRIRHYGLLAGATRKSQLDRCAPST